MYTESELRRMLGEGGPSNQRGIDLAQVIRRSTRRRITQQVAIGGATTLAVAGIGVASVTGVRWLGAQSSSLSSGAGSSSAVESPRESSNGNPLGDEATIRRDFADKINLCGEALAPVAPNQSGLLLTADFASAAASADLVSGTVTLTNNGTEHIVGSTLVYPDITLSRDGITLWHSNGGIIMMAAMVDLAPGASRTYKAYLEPVICGVEDDLGNSFRTDLPHVTPGEYQVSAMIILSHRNADGSFAGHELVTGPVSGVTLR